MTTMSPVARLTATYADADLRTLVEPRDPADRYLTAVIPAPSQTGDAEHRLAVRWQNARREAQGWPDDLLVALDDELEALDHAAADAFVIVQRSDGYVHIEPLPDGVDAPLTQIGEAPRLVEILAQRQRTLPHVLVVTDRAGADLVAFDGGQVVAQDNVDGDTEHIHRGQPGGWSQRRFQQRAENTWEANATEVAHAIGQLADEHDAQLIAIAGDVRAKRLVSESLPTHLVGRTVELEAGDADGIAAECLRHLTDVHARLVVDTVAAWADAQGPTGADAVRSALADHRVSTLLVAPNDEQNDTIDRFVVDALRSGAAVIVTPNVAALADRVAALVRW